ncbi:hypothetical protein IEZ26_12615 [Nocardioides cavernae]|uniref:Uncharacterized protein n=1 Tax=Nocardioides cavernae TaxID=1921566 RepID=A0ABR8NBI1_9ACTN|nr:hypothetical protein [Nocardioides cavernae]MBD3925473.1 hypothetical protein [Nocardioides cavernae]MBM7514148.1 hypothetical protein [Nocardioides cavernae]
MVQEVSASRGTEPGPPASEVEEEGAAALPGSAVEAGLVPLDRLLAVVTLSPAEAVFVAGRLVESTDVPPQADGALPQADRWVVSLTASGGVAATRAGPRGGTAVADLLGALVHNARRLPAHPTPGQLVLLRQLEEAAAEAVPEPGARAGRLRRALVETLGGEASERLGSQLADLVGAYAHMAGSTPAATGVARPAPDPPGPQPSTPTRFSPGRPRSRGPAAGRRRAPGRRVALAALLLVVAVAGSGYVLTRRTDDASAGADGRDPATAAPTGKASAGTSPKPSDRASSGPRPRIETLAPRRAGALTGVELRRAGACSPGALCAVTVTARFRPAQSAQTLTWRVGTATSCEGSVSWSPPVSVTAQPGWTTVYASSSVPIPRRPAVALVATTTAPARAQSAPVPVTGSTLRC